MKSSELNPKEYHPYYQPYITVLGDQELLVALKSALVYIYEFIQKIPDDKLTYSYQEGKWSIAEVLVHLMDAERVFQYRALRFGRKDKTELMGFEQDDYIPSSKANERSKKSILDEFIAIRQSSLALFESFDVDALLQMGKANGANMSVRALGFVICGHQAHHFNIIRERYL